MSKRYELNEYVIVPGDTILELLEPLGYTLKIVPIDKL